MYSWDYLFNHPDLWLNVAGVEIFVQKGVFLPDPKITYSAQIFMDHVPDFTGKRVLDVGTGSGVLGLYAALQGAESVLAVDNNSLAIETAQYNVKKLQLGERVSVQKSDLFTKIEGSFDCIVGNLPILTEVWDDVDDTSSVIEQYLDHVGSYLSEGGSAYFMWASFAPIEQVRELLARSPHQVTETTEDKMGFTWNLFELKKN